MHQDSANILQGSAILHSTLPWSALIASSVVEVLADPNPVPAQRRALRHWFWFQRGFLSCSVACFGVAHLVICNPNTELYLIKNIPMSNPLPPQIWFCCLHPQLFGAKSCKVHHFGRNDNILYQLMESMIILN